MIEPREAPTASAIATHYDELDRWYREVWGEHVHHGLWDNGSAPVEAATRRLVDRVAALAGIEAGHVVCDAGCGYGGTARVLARDYGATVHAATLSEAQFLYAQEQARSDDTCTFYCRDFLAHGFEAGSCEAVISIESSEHMPDKPAFFAKALRLLKPGGALCVCAWLAADPVARWKVRHLLEPICREGRLPGMGTAAEYKTWFAEAGFVDVRFESVGRQVRKTWPVIIGRMARRLTWDREARRYLTAGPENRVFAKTVFRIAAAYYLGAMDYGLFAARRPSAE